MKRTNYILTDNEFKNRKKIIVEKTILNLCIGRKNITRERNEWQLCGGILRKKGCRYWFINYFQRLTYALLFGLKEARHYLYQYIYYLMHRFYQSWPYMSIMWHKKRIQYRTGMCPPPSRSLLKWRKWESVACLGNTKRRVPIGHIVPERTGNMVGVKVYRIQDLVKVGVRG